MTKELFLFQLKESLNACHVDQAASEKYLRRFEKMIDATPKEEVEQKIASFGKPSDIAARIVSINPAAVTAPAASAAPRQAPPKPASKPAPSGKPAAAAKPSGRPAPSAPSAPRRSKEEPVRAREYSERGEKLFWWTVGLSSPIWIFLVCCIAALFICAYTAILLLTALLIILEVGIIVGGVLVAVVGIVYGIMQMLPGTATPYIGLYELGLGIKIGGIVLIVGIAVYNFVINMAPLSLRSLTRFGKFTAKSLWKLVLRARKECSKL